MARTFQNLCILGNMSVLDNVMVGRHRHEKSYFVKAGLRLPSRREEERRSRETCMAVLGLVGLADRVDEMAASLPYGQQRLVEILAERRKQTAGSLSGGEQQMLAIGRALMGRPRLLLLDEPSMGLAPIMVTAIFEALTVLNARGLSLLMVEQNAEAALAISDRAVVMVTGEVVLTERAADLQDDPRLHDFYLGRKEMTLYELAEMVSSGESADLVWEDEPFTSNPGENCTGSRGSGFRITVP